MGDLWRDFWIRETGTGQQVTQLHDIYDDDDDDDNRCLWSLKYNQQDATFSRSIYFYKLLCMFQAVPPPIIRSTKLYIERQVLSNQYSCCRGWGSSRHEPCFRRFFRPSSGAQNCTYSVRYCQSNSAACCYRGWDSSRQQYWFNNTWRCMYSFVLLLMGGGTAWNM
jgi:hypothetical protein